MTQIRVSAEAVGQLGERLADLATFVADAPRAARDDAWALGPGDSGAALEALLGDWEHQRRQLAQHLDDLAAAARDAGAAYLRAEARAGAVVGGPTP
jgi:hypothetical protein